MGGLTKSHFLNPSHRALAFIRESLRFHTCVFPVLWAQGLRLSLGLATRSWQTLSYFEKVLLYPLEIIPLAGILSVKLDVTLEVIYFNFTLF